MPADIARPLAALLAVAAASSLSPAAADAWRGPVGFRGLTTLDSLPRLRSESRTLEVSSYDRTGGNDDGLYGTYSCPRRVAAGCVIAERRGPGEIESIWFTRDFGNLSATGRIQVRIDGRTVLSGQLEDVVAGRSGGAFRFPLVAGPTESTGGGYIRVPMPFRRSMRVVTENNPSYYHVIFRAFRSARGVRAFRPRDRAAAASLPLARSGLADPKPRQARAGVTSRRFSVAAGRDTTIARARRGGTVSALELRLPGVTSEAAARVLAGARLRMRFDGRRTVDAPLGEFFGSGLGPANVRSLMFAQGPGAGDWMRSWWPMPYARSMSVAIRNTTADPIDGELRLITERPRWTRALRTGEAGYFHARGHGPAPTRRGHDWSFLRVRGRGTFVGVTQVMRATVPFYLEGDEQAYVDGRRRPDWQGTGTEDFYEGGWYFTAGFRPRLFTLPFAGFTRLLEPPTGCPEGDCRSAYRLMLTDAVPFQRSLRFAIEHGPVNLAPAVYSSTAYWYQSRARPR